MADRVIPQRELRNDVAAILRAAEAGETFTVTVRGRPVARLVPPEGPRRFVAWGAVVDAMRDSPVDEDWLTELRAGELPQDDPWP